MDIKQPDIEQLVNTLFSKKGNYIPMMELGVHPEIKEQFLGRKIASLQDEVDFWYLAGYDYIKLQPIADFHIPGYVADESISNLIKWAPHSALITNWDDFENFKFLVPQEIDYTPYESVGAYLPPGMGVIAQYGDIFTMTWQLMGFENFAISLFENPDLVSAILEKLGATVLTMFEYFAQNDIVDAIWYSDDIAYITGLMISPDDLRQYVFPWIKKIGDLAKAYNKPLIYHSDGKLLDVLDDIIQCGVNALHPIEPKAMDIFNLEAHIKPKELCLVGNIDVGDILSMGSTDDVRSAVLKLMEYFKDRGGYCIGSGNSIPNYVKFENYLTLINSVKSFR